MIYICFTQFRLSFICGINSITTNNFASMTFQKLVTNATIVNILGLILILKIKFQSIHYKLLFLYIFIYIEQPFYFCNV